MIQILENGVVKSMTIEEYNNYMKSLHSSFKTNPNGTPIDGRIPLKDDDGNYILDENGNYTFADIGKVWINGEEFDGMSDLVTVNTKTYVTEPVRYNNGAMTGINDLDTFIVPRCRINFKYFNIEDYKRLCNAIISNEFIVKYFDKQFGKYVSHNMYAQPEELTKIYNIGLSVIGVIDYEINFIGTLNDLQTFKVKYHFTDSNGNNLTHINYNDYSASSIYSKGQIVKHVSDDNVTTYYIYINETSGSNHALEDVEYWNIVDSSILNEQEYDWGSSTVIKSSNDLATFYTIPSGKSFGGWNTKQDYTGYTYKANQSINIFENIDLYPIFKN